jgi:hypothetical protein
VALFTLDWPWSSAASVASAWQQWLTSVPDELWSNCQLLSNGETDGTVTYTARIAGVYVGEVSALNSVLDPLLSSAGVDPTYKFVGPESYLNAMLIEAGCEGFAVNQCHLGTADPPGKLDRASFAAKSAFVSSPVSTQGFSDIVSAVESLGHSVPSAGGGFVFDALGGAINRVAADATAFVHRNAHFGVQYSVTWPNGSTSAVIDASDQWLATSQSMLTPYVNGQAYQNYIDPTLSDWQQAYYGSNLSQLVTVKGVYDPDNLFHFAQSIPTSL